MKGFCLQVSGELACFTRPEMKVERVSYDVITPSAARAIFDAILWKPAIRWQITRIEVLAPIKWTSVRRNEVGKVASARGGGTGILIEDDRQQRASMLLRDVAYRLHAVFDYIPPERRTASTNPLPAWLIDREDAEDLARPESRAEESEAKYAAMFQRRARKGQCFNQPYLGCREFACQFRLIEDVAASQRDAPALAEENRDLGWMLYDLDFTNPADPRPLWYRPTLRGGVIEVPARDSQEVRG